MATITLLTDEPPDTLRALAAMLEHLAEMGTAPADRPVRTGASVDAVVTPELRQLHKEWMETPQPAPASVVPPPPATAESERVLQDLGPVAVTLDDRQADAAIHDRPIPQPPAALWDANGYPWDERIHSSSRALLADGSWRQRRNLPPGVREAVEAELRAAGKVAPAAHAAAPVAPPPPPVSVVPPAGLPLTVPPPPPPAPPVGEVLPPPVAPGHTLGTFMPLVTRAMTEGKLTVVQIMEACQAAGLPLGLNSLGERPEAIPALAATLGLAL